MVDIERTTRNIARTETLLILLSVVAIAYADQAVGSETSLGFLYLIPLSYSALTHPLRITIGLMVICVGLRQWLGPLEQASWGEFSRDLVLTAIFLALVARLLHLGSDRREFFASARSQRDEMLRELRLAAAVQKRILGRSTIPRQGLDVAARTWPAGVIGGDFYDLSKVEGNRFRVVIGDVAGKGLPAALLMSAIRIGLRALDDNGNRSETDVVTRLNQLLFRNTPDAMYSTLFYSVLEPSSGKLTFVNAGHLPPLLTRADGSQQWLPAGGPPLGLLPETETQAASVTLEAGDLLLLYTDGAVEAFSPQGAEFGADRLARLAAELLGLDSQAVVRKIRARVKSFQQESSDGDDLTLIAVRRRPEGGSPPVSPPS